MKILLIIGLIFKVLSLHSQGCSDAGACSAGSLGLHDGLQGQRHLSVSYDQTVGLADKESLALTSEVTLSHGIFPGMTVEARIPYMVTIGNLATTSGLGDLMLSLSKVIMQNEEAAITVVGGGRIKANNADKSAGDQPLPMVYQSSLGTNNIIAGVALQHKRWSASIGWQHSFGANENKYLRPEGVILPENRQYFESAYLRRGDDVMLRLQRTFVMNDKDIMSAGVLPIYRIQKDQIKRNGVYEELPDSDGITFNLFYNWRKQIDENKTFTLAVGFPVYARKYRSDGLTRTAVISAGIVFNFVQPPRKSESIQGLFEHMND